MATESVSRRILPRTVKRADTVDMDALFRDYSPYVGAIAMRLLGREDEVDDVVQDVFCAAIKGIDRVREPAAIPTWLGRITVRTAIRRLRRRRLRSALGLGDSVDYEQIASPTASPRERAQIAALYSALDAVPSSSRVAWLLRHVEGHDLRTVARLCQCSLATAKRRIRRANDVLSQAVGT